MIQEVTLEFPSLLSELLKYKKFCSKTQKYTIFFIACFFGDFASHGLDFLTSLLTYLFIYLFSYLFVYLLIYFTQNNCLLIFLEAPHPRPVFTHASGQGVTCRRRQRREENEAKCKRVRSARISISGVAYRRNMFRYSPSSIRASFDHVHCALASSIGGLGWRMFPLQFDPPTTPPVTCWRRQRRRQGSAPCLASEIAPHPAERPNKN